MTFSISSDILKYTELYFHYVTMLERIFKKNDMSTSKESIQWTETSVSSKLKDITEVLNDAEIQDIAIIWTLKSLLQKKEYKLFQHEIWMNNPHGKLWYKSLDFVINYVNRIKDIKSLKESEEFNLKNVYNWIISWWKSWNENVDDSIALKDTSLEYREKYQSLGNYEYKRLFTGLENVQQTIWPDCYLVCAINQISRSQYFETLIKTSIRRAKRGNWDIWYRVRLPLWSTSGRDIFIKDSEIPKAKIQWGNWYKILEIAYTKYVTRAEKDNKYSPITENDFKAIAWWKSDNAMKVLIGKENIEYTVFWWEFALKRISSTQKDLLKENLKDYNPSIWNKYVSLSSLSYKEVNKEYDVWWKKLYRGHAYILAWVIKDASWEIKSIEVLNPFNKTWDGQNFLSFTFEEFLHAFRRVAIWRVKTQSFLKTQTDK